MSNTTRLAGFLSFAPTLLVSMALLGGCGGDDQAEETAESGESPQMIERKAPKRESIAQPEAESGRDSTDFSVVPRLEGQLEENGLGLETIIDASSKQAYADSLAWISEDVSAPQYKQLERSLRFIRSYDPSVLGDEQRFLRSIDGKTGQELIDRANRLMQERR